MGRNIVVGDCFRYQGITLVMTEEDRDSYHFQAAGIRGHYWRKNSLSPSHEPLPTLHLPIGNDLKRHGGKWFDMILSGEKTEEYREIAGQKQTYHNVGILTTCRMGLAQYEGKTFGDIYLSNLLKSNFKFKSFKVIHLTNGYGHHRPQLWAHIEEITIGKGKPEWGAPEHDVFIIRLGAVFHTKNLKK